MNGEGSRLLLVLVGTDHHPFDRLVSWVDGWLDQQPDRPRAVFQHGTSQAPAHAEARPFLGRSELDSLMAAAAVVVSHGGPATITEARRHGRLPLVVPRDPRLGEHVDDHQQLFARRMGRSGFVRTCETLPELHAGLSAGFAHPWGVQVDVEADRSRVNASLARFGQVVDPLIDASGRRAPRRTRRPAPPVRTQARHTGEAVGNEHPRPEPARTIQGATDARGAGPGRPDTTQEVNASHV